MKDKVLFPFSESINNNFQRGDVWAVWSIPLLYPGRDTTAQKIWETIKSQKSIANHEHISNYESLDYISYIK